MILSVCFIYLDPEHDCDGYLIPVLMHKEPHYPEVKDKERVENIYETID